MSVTPNDIRYYGSANMPEVDGATVGGAIDFTKKIFFTDIGAADTIDAVSSSASDTATKGQVRGRDAAGNIVTGAAYTFTGTTPVVNVGALGTIERIEAAVNTGGAIAGLVDPTGTTAVGDIAVYRHTAIISAHTAQTGAANTTGTTPPLFKLQAGDGVTVAIGQIIRIKTLTGANQLRQIIAITGYGTDVVAINRDWTVVPDNTSTYDVYQGLLFDLSPNLIKAQARVFATVAADAPGGASRTFYEKVFVVNENTTISYTGAQIEILSESPTLPAGALVDIALCKALNDTQTATNRQTLPTNGDASALTFVTQPAFVSVIAGAGQLPNGAVPNAAGAQGIWIRGTLPAGTTVYKGAGTLRATGSTT